MDQRQYNQRKRQYARRTGLYAPAYRHSSGQEREPLPYSIFFRVRLVFCVILFMSFAYMEHYVLSETQERKLYQILEDNTSSEKWKDYAAEAFSMIKSQ